MKHASCRRLTALFLASILLVAALPSASAAALERGSRGEHVLELKQRMFELGYFTSSNFSNEYNGTTADRVRRLQKMNGLAQTGRVTEELWSLIFSDACIAADGTAAPDPRPTAAAEAAETPDVEESTGGEPPAADRSAPLDVPGAPERDSSGFLTEDTEFAVQDMENGFWAYLSDTLQVVIHRRRDPQEKVIWFECDIRTTGDERMTSLQSEKNKWLAPRAIARANQAVLAFSDDFFDYRQYNKMPVGIVIRNGRIISNKTKKPTVGGFPKLENMAYFADGTLKCYDALAHTAQEYLDMGCTDVLAFGPILVTDGHLGEHMHEDPAEAKKENYYHYREPRLALGMVGPGHYIVLNVTGRTSKAKGAIPGVTETSASNGVYLDWVALKMLELGATEAINLDGGWTISLCFLGESLNMKYTSSRKTRHMMSFGTSELAATD